MLRSATSPWRVCYGEKIESKLIAIPEVAVVEATEKLERGDAVESGRDLRHSDNRHEFIESK